LRGATRKAIEDEEFRAIFETDESIRARWPLETKEIGLFYRYRKEPLQTPGAHARGCAWCTCQEVGGAPVGTQEVAADQEAS
jgi:hypothetical protein